RVAVVDDHQIVIDGIQSLLEGHEQIEIVFTGTSPQALLQALPHILADILLTDIMMPGMSGQELARLIRRQYPSIKILALSMSGQGSVVDEMINEADISGYVLKNIGKKELIAAIEKVADGGIYFNDEVLSELARFSERRKESEEISITAREKEIIGLIEKEYSNKQIADTLFISERTVETHRKNIFRKTGTNSVLGLIKYAYDHKLILRGNTA
ncbi:MAG TPA: response regulator transcription factor, partial [Sediminibacterium sp.]